MAARLQSPTSPFFLGSNDDNRERAQARAAPAAAIWRKSVALNLRPHQGDPNHGLGKAQILELFQNCIKLASENKINQKNTWEVNLIDHLTDIINVEEEKDAETNFQKASCTLEGGVKIYSMRVDSVHSEAYKVLGGMNRVGQGSEQGCKTKRSILILKVVLYLIQNNFLTCGQSKFCESCVLGILVIIPFQDTRVEDANADNGKDAASSKNETQKKVDCSLIHYSDLLNSRTLNADINPYMQIFSLINVGIIF
ncbi:condensin complex subunit 2-like isoform X2 [Malus sylvestris]|uniref:condensin complex subunit 2-like isoform X2 n=1 Tax=Malus sylvestris TaxID=3752 RepID=UPI0021AD3D65|nr:condensin complex subunit 2-like isoform X2 [Malus sylvestris]